ncbi:hypothetical protein FHW12_000638 [Dokdonella fugitiva]|uniref:Uncharacterized protein n=1 Tax=Dokdonella fugitiva TaxID=328517 RepID=A0A839EQ49_9GAMM|nr:hypothetical protein [Dokdonella fugitiva]MBA8886447.1 hypothetical protein [Dokdonella fugitiva]
MRDRHGRTLSGIRRGETTLDFTVNAGPLASDVDTLVIFRNGFDGD